MFLGKSKQPPSILKRGGQENRREVFVFLDTLTMKKFQNFWANFFNDIHTIFREYREVFKLLSKTEKQKLLFMELDNSFLFYS